MPNILGPLLHNDCFIRIYYSKQRSGVQYINSLHYCTGALFTIQTIQQTALTARLKSIMLLNSPIILSGNSF